MQNNIITLSERRAAAPYAKRTATAAAAYSEADIEVTTLYADEDTVTHILRCLGYPST